MPITFRDKFNGLTAERLREILHYDPETGVFRWLVMLSRRMPAGKVAGKTNDSGYILIRIEGFHYRAHRLAWLYVYGVWPEDQIDHVDGNRINNRIFNLREATQLQNSYNKVSRENKTGYSGVNFDERRKKFLAKCKIDGKNKFLGYFDNPQLAFSAYKDALKIRGAFSIPHGGLKWQVS